MRCTPNKKSKDAKIKVEAFKNPKSKIPTVEDAEMEEEPKHRVRRRRATCLKFEGCNVGSVALCSYVGVPNRVWDFLTRGRYSFVPIDAGKMLLQSRRRLEQRGRRASERSR
jgi:hypothetical protein